MVVWLALGLATAWVLAPQLESLRAGVSMLVAVQPVWVVAGLGLVALRYASATLSLQAVVGRPIPFTETLLVQLASSFVGKVTPEGVGWLVLTQRYLERSGVTRSAAVAAISLKLLAGAVTRLLIAVGVVAATGAALSLPFDVLAHWPLALGAAAVATAIAIGVAHGIRARAPRIAGAALSGARELVIVMQQPRRAALLLVTSGGLTLTSGLALATSVRAYGADVSTVSVLAVYLGATAVASLSPTPGNLGAAEVALTAGLSATGVPASTAVAAVLLYRLLTFWLPVLPGFLAFRYLQQRALL